MIRPLVRVAVIAALVALALPRAGGSGIASAQPPGGRGRGMAMMGMMMSHSALLRQEAVQTELGLSAEQKAKLAEAVRDSGPGGGANFREMSDEQRTKIQESMQALRQQGGGGDRAELRRKTYESAVKLLSTEQVAKLDSLRGPAFDISKLQLRGPGGRGPGGGN